MKLKLLRGTTSKLLRVFVQDSSKTDGSGLTGLAYNTSGLAWYYCYEGDTAARAVTLQTATLGIYSTGGLIVVDGTNMPGVYEIGVPNAALGTGNSVVMILRGAANMVPVLIEIELDAVNYQDAVHLGLTCLPNTAVATNGSLVTAGAGTSQIALSGGNVSTTIAGSVTVGGYSTGQDPATLLYVTPANKLATDGSGKVLLQATQTGVTIPTVTTVTNAVTAGTVSDKTGYSLNLAQAIPTSNTAQTVGDALNAARAQGFGRWVLSGTALTIFAADGTTPVRTFTLDSASAPTQRS
jgi:hypothetical protein